MGIGRSSAADPARRLRVAGWGLVSFVGALVCGFPLFDLARELAAAGRNAVADVFDGGRAWGPIAATLWTSALVTVLTLAGAMAAAIAIAGVSGRRRAFVIGAMALPLLVPPFVSALSWVSAYGPGGLLDDLAGVSVPGLIGPVGVVLVLAVSAMPIAFLVLTAAVDARHERDLVRAARIAGASPREAFRTVTLPLLRPALVAAGAITFIMSANAFGVPAVLGSPAGFGTATTRLYRDLVFSADSAAFDRVLVLAAFLALVTLVVVAIADRGGSGPIRLRVEATGPRLGARRMTRRATSGLAIWVGLTTLLPLVALVAMALTRSVGLAAVPGNLTLEHFREALDSGAVSAFGTSLGLGLMAATIVVALGGLLVALERRRRSGAGTLVALAFAVPGSVVAVAVLLAWGPWLRDTVVLILIRSGRDRRLARRLRVLAPRADDVEPPVRSGE
jgi:iron(III) transport system permease protein